MSKRYGLFAGMVVVSLTATAQNNPIFAGGAGDGWANNSYLQQEANNIFSGGSGDGWASNGFQQPENNIFTGGFGDGWASDTTSFTFTIGTAIPESAFGSAIHAYPNPTNGRLTLDLAGEWGPISLEVVNAAGQVVRAERMTGHWGAVDIPGANGTYFLRVLTETGEHATLRVVKH